MLVSMYNYINRTKNRKYRAYGYDIPNFVFYLAAASLLLLMVVLNFGGILKSAKVFVARNDEWALESAAAIYQTYNINNEIPSSVNDLITGYDADESTDGLEHKNLVSSFRVNDPWGGSYTFTDNGDGTTTISTTKGVSTGGLTDEVTRTY